MNESTSLALRNDPVLAKLGQAREALALAQTLQDAKQIADIAKAAEIYAKRQQLGQEAIDYAHAINIEALRRLGEMLRDPSQERASGGQPYQHSTGLNLNPVDISEGRMPTLDEVGINKNTANIARKLYDMPADEFEQVRDGTISMSRAVTQVARAKKKEALSKSVADPVAKYRIVYADPPWAYNDECSEGSVQAQGASRKYPTMTTAELCALPVAHWCEDGAVLFLWVTSPLLPQAWPIIDAWGFEYKASFVWDKIKHNMGHYNSVRHEFLLVCTRGSCTPDVVKLFDSVQSIERTTHSTKPEEFRTIIDILYPYGKRLEMFARVELPVTWDAWGNEAL